MSPEIPFFLPGENLVGRYARCSRVKIAAEIDFRFDEIGKTKSIIIAIER